MHELVGQFIEGLSQFLLGLFLFGLQLRLVGSKFRGLLKMVQRLTQLHGLLLRLGKGRLLFLEVSLVFMHLSHAAIDFFTGALGLLMLRRLFQRMIDLFARHSQEGQFFFGDGDLLFKRQKGLRLFDLGICQAVLGFLERFVDLGITGTQLLTFFQL